MLGRPDFTFIVYLGVGDVIAVVVVVFVSWQTKVIPVIIQFCNCCRKLSRGGPFICCFAFRSLALMASGMLTSLAGAERVTSSSMGHLNLHIKGVPLKWVSAERVPLPALPPQGGPESQT